MTPTLNPEMSLSVLLDDDMRATILTSDPTLAKAISRETTAAGVKAVGDTAAAAAVWSSIADGTADIGRVLVWSQHVAKNLKREVIDAAKNPDPKVRPNAALTAVTLAGQGDKHAAVKRRIDDLEGFDDMTRPGERSTAAEIASICQAIGLLEGLNAEQAKRVIEGLRQGKR